ncbi:MAG: hypothetical protein OXC62_06330 [Aestuariivita sp.]|nr:hypothetical protein [Aestuariivita sp.]
MRVLERLLFRIISTFTFQERHLVYYWKNKLKIGDDHCSDRESGADNPSDHSGPRLVNFRFKVDRFCFDCGRFLRILYVRLEYLTFAFGHSVIQILRWMFHIYRDIAPTASLGMHRRKVPRVVSTYVVSPEHCCSVTFRSIRLLNSTFVAILIVICSGFFSPALAQQPLGAAFQPSDVRATLGDCPAPLLRQAWAEMLPLETAAVEREVLALCTERAETISSFLRAQERLDIAISLVRVSDISSNLEASDGLVDRLRDDVSDLRTRITRLEQGPERPETRATLARLRDDLDIAEADLAQAERARGRGVTSQDSDSADESTTSPQTSPPEATPATTVPAIEPSDRDPPPLDDSAGADRSIAPPSSATIAPEVDLSVAQVATEQSVVSDWEVLHAVKRGDDDWRVLLQGSREIQMLIPSTTPDSPPTIHVSIERDPPITVSINEDLPDGWRVRDVTDDGVELEDTDDPSHVQVLRFSDDHTPGNVAWTVSTLAEGSE